MWTPLVGVKEVGVVVLTVGGPRREAKDERHMAGEFSEIQMYVLLPVFHPLCSLTY